MADDTTWADMPNLFTVTDDGVTSLNLRRSRYDIVDLGDFEDLAGAVRYAAHWAAGRGLVFDPPNMDTYDVVLPLRSIT